jgi:hypothetical protein
VVESYAKAFYAYAMKKLSDRDDRVRNGWNVSGGL